jgi:hypothetical protein
MRKRQPGGLREEVPRPLSVRRGRRAGSAIVDGGAPLTGGNGTVSGYSILQAESSEALADVLDGHPHTTHGGGTIETYEFLPVPGM